MKLLVFGATGSVGRQVVSQALEQGHTVTAFTRDPTKLDIHHDKLTVIQGDALDPQAVAKAVEGQDVVLCSIGVGSKGNVRAEATQNIVRAMEKAGVKRFICQSTLGVGDSWGNLNFLWKYVMFKGLLRQAYADHVAQEDAVTRSRLDWIIIRPGAFTDGPRTGAYRHGFPANDKTAKLKIARADVADFMLKQLSDTTYLHKAPGLSY